jgi:hypothetical protein
MLSNTGSDSRDVDVLPAPVKGIAPSQAISRTRVGIHRDRARPHLLWIDDEKSLSDPDIRVLEWEGFHVDCAITGTEGLALARTSD